MKKRGQATLWFLIELIAAILVVYLAVDLAVSLSTGTIFEKLNIARDISMQINALSALPGDGYIVNNNLHGYSLQFFKNKVEVFENSDEQIKGIHYFVPITPITDLEEGDTPIIKPSRIVVAKIGDKIEISETIPILG
jgi:hypothetical protein|tara:strand:- start:244 stop:657 length:414 start_codon:yes stop_codon:yes gene_type:complete